MENPVRYQVGELRPATKDERIMSSLYWQNVTKFTVSLLQRHGIASPEEVTNYAIALTDRLIEKVGEKI